MTSTLPNFPACLPSLASPENVPAGPATLTELVAQTLAPGAATNPPAEFASLLPGARGQLPGSAAAVVVRPVGVPSADSPHWPSEASVDAPGRMIAMAVTTLLATAAPGPACGLDKTAGLKPTNPARPAPTEAEIEAACAFVAIVLQSLHNQAPSVPSEPVPTATSESQVAETFSPVGCSPVVSSLPSFPSGIAPQGGVGRPAAENIAMAVSRAVAPIATEATPVAPLLTPPVANPPAIASVTSGSLTSSPTEPAPLNRGPEVKTAVSQAPHAPMGASMAGPFPSPRAEPHPRFVGSNQLPNGREFPMELPSVAHPPFLLSVARPDQAPATVPSELTTVTEQTMVAGQPITEMPLGFTVAADGAIEVRIVPAAPVDGPIGMPVESAELTPAPEFEAELVLPGDQVIRVAVKVPRTTRVLEHLAELTEKFAASTNESHGRNAAAIETVERKILNHAAKEVRSPVETAGIAVAKVDGTMISVSTEEIPHSRPPEFIPGLALGADFQVAQSPTERITTGPAAPAVQNFAERAVTTVTSLAEAQFAASMQRAGSVQLRLKFGTENLSVRVEMRGGLVHTDFRTDSPLLREALAAEWQAVAAASPALAQRFLDPVFSPADAGGTRDSGNPPYSGQRQAQQQADGQSAGHSRDPWAPRASFSHRSAVNESFIPEPAVPRQAAFLPTSLRLSALA